MKRRNRYPRRGAQAGFSVFIIVIILAVAAGYAGTKYIIFPYLLGNHPAENTQEQTGKDNTAVSDSAVDVLPNTPSVIIDQQNVKNGGGSTGNTGGAANGSTANTGGSANGGTGNTGVTGGEAGPYCVQFGSFSSKGGADTMSSELSGKGIYSYVYESAGSYKVLGLPYASEAKAKEAASVVSAVVSDVFVVNLSNIIQ